MKNLDLAAPLAPIEETIEDSEPPGQSETEIVKGDFLSRSEVKKSGDKIGVSEKSRSF